MAIKTTKTKITKPKKVVAKVIDDGLFKINIKVNDLDFNITTNNLDDAFRTFDIGRFKTRAIVTIEKDGKSCTKLLNTFQMKMITKSSIVRMVFLNRIILK